MDGSSYLTLITHLLLAVPPALAAITGLIVAIKSRRPEQQATVELARAAAVNPQPSAAVSTTPPPQEPCQERGCLCVWFRGWPAPTPAGWRTTASGTLLRTRRWTGPR
jgi:hypothetical protein